LGEGPIPKRGQTHRGTLGIYVLFGALHAEYNCIISWETSWKFATEEFLIPPTVRSLPLGRDGKIALPLAQKEFLLN
jgi:hypothetical protein